MSQVCWLLAGKGGFNQLSSGPHLLSQVHSETIGLFLKIMNKAKSHLENYFFYWNIESIEKFQLSVSSVICPTGISIIPLTHSMGRFEQLQRLPSQDGYVWWIICHLPNSQYWIQVILCGDSYCFRLEGDKWKEAAQLTEKRWGNTTLGPSLGERTGITPYKWSGCNILDRKTKHFSTSSTL